MLAGKDEDWVRRAISLLRSLNPVRAELNGKLTPWGTKSGTMHTTTELVTGLDYEEVCDSLLGQLARCSNACDAAAEDEYLFGLRW